MDASYDGTEVTVLMEEIEEAYCYTSSGPPKKKKKYKIHGEKAKKPRSAYLLYYYDIYLKVQQELPHLPQSEINKKISESWRLLSVAERSYYLEKAKLEKEGLDPNSKLSALTAVVPDIPGFRKILPRSDYIIIPKSSLQEDRSCPQIELCMAQNQIPPKGLPLPSNTVPETVSSHASMAEQCLAVEALAEEVGALAQPGGVQEIATSEILSQDMLLEEASLEVGESHQPYQTSLVIEETLLNGSPDFTPGSLAMPHPQIGESVSVVTVVRDSSEGSSSAPAAQFIMVPLPAYSVVENPTSIKLTTTYTRRGHGTCTSPGCSFTYVTRHKPPKCPTCGNFLGGKWIPKEKPAKVKVESASDVSSNSSVTSEQNFCNENDSKVTLENSEAVSQLLNVVPPREVGEENEWEEVIVSDAHVLVKGGPGNRGTAVTKAPVVKNFVKTEVTLETPENDSPRPYIPPAAEGSSTSSPVPAFKKPTGVDLLSTGPRATELKGRARGKPSLLAAARPMRAILPAPASVGRGSSMGLPRARQTFPLSDKTSSMRTCGLKPSTLKQLGQPIQQPSSTGEVKLPSDSNNRTPQVKVVEVKPDIFPPYKYSCTVTLDLGLATSRGRGKCKNPSCSYVYTNRHKPRICPSCGFNLAKDRTEKSTKALFTWPEFLGSSEVNVEDFWATMETEVIEQVAFPASIPITKFDASVIAPFFPPLMRGAVVVNTEKDKNLDVQPAPGNGSALVRLLQEGTCKLEELGSYSEHELQHLLKQCGIPYRAEDSRDQLCLSFLALYESVQNGARARQPPPHLTGGKIYKMCPHQVVCGSKYLVRGESARDHVDLLASSRHWPPVYVVDTATPVALCADLCYPELTSQMWGRNQGCFSSPTEPPVSVSCPELLDQHYSVDVIEAEHSIQHPVTKTPTRRIVHAGTQPSPSDPSAGHHSLSLCPELAPYTSILASTVDSKPNSVRQRPIAFDNATHYYLYNRLIDFLTSREIVNRQIHDIVQSCQPGEVVIRDTLYRLGVAQIKTETEEEGGEEEVATATK
ncbi:PREDICTED: HMG domain-containing protein 3 [Dipodomys ordii]|uniref:HMG domain-containing protein 3 n=1 Tax=Dipodomys ordii TaxID=10020 RepID=A0A1S3FX27_DIPOR|nr:PREDICTED: HMG domain-containing protein 3 [Dipodomys ordii]